MTVSVVSCDDKTRYSVIQIIVGAILAPLSVIGCNSQVQGAAQEEENYFLLPLTFFLHLKQAYVQLLKTSSSLLPPSSMTF